MHILLIEPNPQCAFQIEEVLKRARMTVTRAGSGDEGVDMVLSYGYDLIVLQYSLSDMEGIEVIQALRARKISTPVLVLMNHDSLESRVRAFNAGADDCVTRPFHVDEFIARIHAIVRRACGHTQSIITIGEIELDLRMKEVRMRDVPLILTSSEYKILELLCLHKGELLTRETFLNHLYGGMDEPTAKVINVFVLRIRKKLRTLSLCDAEYIETVRARGYVLHDPKERKVATALRSPNTMSQLTIMSLITGRLEQGRATFLDLLAHVHAVRPATTPATVRTQVWKLMTAGVVRATATRPAVYSLSLIPAQAA